MSEASSRGEKEGRSASTGTSRSLLDCVRANEPQAWDRLVTLYAPLVFYWCRRWELPAQDAGDVFQEVFGAVARHISTFRKEERGDTFRGWLRTITHNKVRDHFRREGREARAAGGTDAGQRLARLPVPEPVECVSENQAEQALVRRALELIRGEFAERTWQAFWRTAVDGRPAKDVGLELNMTAGAVRVARSRVLQRLRAELGDSPGE
jgi:RNA polymerase sigma-70 factor (ECF subfamily)